MTKTKKEKGQLEGCPCGNAASSGYFYPCDETGRDIDEDAARGGLVVCDVCGRILSAVTSDVVGQRSPGILPSFCRLPRCDGEQLAFSVDQETGTSEMFCANEYCPRYDLHSDEASP